MGCPHPPLDPKTAILNPAVRTESVIKRNLNELHFDKPGESIMRHKIIVLHLVTVQTREVNFLVRVTLFNSPGLQLLYYCEVNQGTQPGVKKVALQSAKTCNF